MAAVRTDSVTGSEADQTEADYLILRVSNERYILQGAYISEITRWRAPLPVPGAPPALPGIINQRGVILPVVDMRLLLGLAETPPDRATRYVLVHCDDVEMALYVDTVLDLITLSASNMEVVPATLDPQRGRLLKALTRLDDEPVGILDPATIITMLRPEL